MHLTESVHLMEGTCMRKVGQAQLQLGDCKGAKCTYDGRNLYKERVFEFFVFPMTGTCSLHFSTMFNCSLFVQRFGTHQASC